VPVRWDGGRSRLAPARTPVEVTAGVVGLSAGKMTVLPPAGRGWLQLCQHSNPGGRRRVAFLRGRRKRCWFSCAGVP